MSSREGFCPERVRKKAGRCAAGSGARQAKVLTGLHVGPRSRAGAKARCQPQGDAWGRCRALRRFAPLADLRGGFFRLHFPHELGPA